MLLMCFNTNLSTTTINTTCLIKNLLSGKLLQASDNNGIIIGWISILKPELNLVFHIFCPQVSGYLSFNHL